MRARKQLFSIRMGYRKEDPPQVESLNPNTRIAFYGLFTDTITEGGASWSEFGEIFLHLPRNAIYDPDKQEVLESVKKQAEVFFLEKDWFLIFDVIEWLEERAFVAPDGADGFTIEGIEYDMTRFCSQIDSILWIHGVGYDFIEGKFIPLSNEAESSTVRDAVDSPSKKVKWHIRKAISLLDRNNPDYENSIKESISAVEGILIEVAGEKKFEFKKVSAKLRAFMHPKFISVAGNLYQFSSDEGGVRHAIKDKKQQEIDQDAAVCMLVTCSAIANYLAAKMPQLKKEEAGKAADDDNIPF